MASEEDISASISNEEEEGLRVMELTNNSVLPMVLRSAIELDFFEIMAKANVAAGVNGEAQLSSDEIASHIATQNREAPIMIERMLRYLATNSIVTCSTDGDGKRYYGLAPISKYFLRGHHDSFVSSIAMFQDRVIVDCWHHLKDAVIDGGIPFNKAHGMHAFEYPATDSRFNDIFNRAMCNRTTVTMKKVLEKYNGFEGVKEVVDVGGGLGATLSLILSKYPHIKGINFDLPHVLQDAPHFPGVEHVGGDMFESVPEGEVIFMKWILHDWGDENCLKILNNCWKALPESGKLIVVEVIMPEYPKTDLISKAVTISDVLMLTLNPGGKERTLKQFQDLAQQTGFSPPKLVCTASVYWVMEFYKIM